MLEATIATGTPCPVSASAITDPRVAAELVDAGFKGLLIGTGLLQSGNVQAWVDEFEQHRAVLADPHAAPRSA
jgi:indole-3-glycerol phosphate synthase